MNELAGSQEARTIPSTTPLLAKLAQKRTAWTLWIATLVVAAIQAAEDAAASTAPRGQSWSGSPSGRGAVSGCRLMPRANSKSG